MKNGLLPILTDWEKKINVKVNLVMVLYNTD